MGDSKKFEAFHECPNCTITLAMVRYLMKLKKKTNKTKEVIK